MLAGVTATSTGGVVPVTRCRAPPRSLFDRRTRAEGSNETSRASSLGGFGQQRPAGQHSRNLAPSRGRPIDRPCARRFAGDWTADGMSCPLRREHLIIRLQVSPGAV
jgi:hypothetical protein